MFYEFPLTIPANTAKASMTRSDIILTYGVIHRVEVQFPAGCAGLVHASLWRFEHQIAPTNPDQGFTADGYVISFNEFYLLEDPPFKGSIRGWNEDDTYDHTIIFRIGILPIEVLVPWAPRKSALTKLKEALIG